MGFTRKSVFRFKVHSADRSGYSTHMNRWIPTHIAPRNRRYPVRGRHLELDKENLSILGEICSSQAIRSSLLIQQIARRILTISIVPYYHKSLSYTAVDLCELLIWTQRTSAVSNLDEISSEVSTTCSQSIQQTAIGILTI